MTEARRRTLETYEKSAVELAEYFSGIGSRVADIERAFRLRGIEKPHVAEVGCGNGRDAREICVRTPYYIGTDSSAAMIALAKKQCPEGTFIIAPLETWEVPQDTDIVFAFAALLHSNAEQMEDFFRRAAKQLRPGSLIYISLKRGRYHRMIKKDIYGEREFYIYSPSGTAKLAKPYFTPIYQESQQIGKQAWFTLVLERNQM